MAPRPSKWAAQVCIKRVLVSPLSNQTPHKFLLMPQRPHKTPLDRANSFLQHEAERGIKTDPDNGNYWLHKMKEAEDELDRIAGEMMKDKEES